MQAEEFKDGGQHGRGPGAGPSKEEQQEPRRGFPAAQKQRQPALPARLRRDSHTTLEENNFKLFGGQADEGGGGEAG